MMKIINFMEIWKDIKGYEGLYQISSWGRVKSIGYTNQGKHDFIMKIRKSNSGYLYIRLYKNKLCNTVYVHHIVWDNFGGNPRDGRKLQVDHIDNCKINNKIDNLQLLNNRDNTSKDKKNKTSKYTGVSWNKRDNIWQAGITIKGKRFNLGSFNNEYEAHETYEKTKNNLK